MKYLRSAILCVFFILCQTNSVFAEKSDSYALSVGKADLQRLQNLNEAVNGYSVVLLEKYVKPGDSVLELGSGIGLTSQEIAKLVGNKGKVLAVDISNEQLFIARDLVKDPLSNLTFKQSSVYDLKVRGMYDVVYARFLFIHLTDVNKAIQEAVKYLKPGGYFIAEELRGNNTISSSPKDQRLDLVKEIDSLQEEVQKTNFSIADSLDKTFEANGLNVVYKGTIHPKLDTLNKRRNFSMGMRSLEETLVKNDKISRENLHKKIKEVEKMEEDHKVDLYFYKMGQVVGQKPLK
jgi:ubiquinone/menaquinone biosynthesis C-methylase UbiE